MNKIKSLLIGLLMSVVLVASSHAATATPLVGKNVTFSFTVSGTPPFTQQWKKDGVNIAGATGTSYNIPAVTLADTGTYTAVITNSAGSTTTDNGVITVYSLPSFTTQPVSVVTTIGGTATFTVAGTGVPTPTLQWKKNGVNIAGATTNTLTFASVVQTDTGFYTCVATNAAGSTTSTEVTLTVNAVAPIVSPITITIL